MLEVLATSRLPAEKSLLKVLLAVRAVLAGLAGASCPGAAAPSRLPGSLVLLMALVLRERERSLAARGGSTSC